MKAARDSFHETGSETYMCDSQWNKATLEFIIGHLAVVWTLPLNLIETLFKQAYCNVCDY